MEVEILLDMSRVDPDNQELIRKRFNDWYAEGAEVRYNKKCFGKLTVLEEPNRYRVDLGNVDTVIAIRELHACLYRFGVKVFVHFMP